MTLQPGETTNLQEIWHLFPLTEHLEITSEEALAEWIAPFIEKAGVQ